MKIMNVEFLTLGNVQLMLKKLAEEYQLASSEDKEVDIQIDVPMENPQILADQNHLYGALGNLIGNAVKYSDEKVEILLSCYREKRKICLSVKDNGYGIAPEIQKNIFDSHYRHVDPECSRTRKGYGIGLNYVHAVIMAHKGTIQVVSDGKTGSEFQIKLPQ